ncbi:MAG: hypothetical protein ACE5KE_07955 [Methanosarcinales archaeon]
MKYTKLDVLNLMEKELRFSKHALEQMYLPSRLLSKDEVKDAIIRGEIVDIEEVQERCDKIAIQAYNPTIFISVGMCCDYLLVITTWRGVK